MLKIMTYPGRYIQDYNAVSDFAEHASRYGNRPFIIGGKTALSLIRDRIEPGINEHGLEPLFSEFTGKGTQNDAFELAEKAKNHGADIITGVGGGLAIDTAKAAAFHTDLPLVIIPTISSTDAPCSSVALQYREDHVIDNFIVLKRNPDLVLVDTKIIAEAPTRFFIAGMGDALATWFEANTCFNTGAKNMAGGYPTAAGKAIARLTYDTLMEYGVAARMDVDLNVVTPAVEMVIEANSLLSSVGFENCGLGAAHSFGIGVGTMKGTEDRLHGELVSFGVVANLIIENYRGDEIDRVLKFCVDVGLPVTLKELGVTDLSDEAIKQAGKECFSEGSNMQNLAFNVSEEMAADIIISADALGRKYLGR